MVIGDADRDTDVDLLSGQAEIRDVRTCNGFVRNHNGVACAEGNDGGKAPCDIRDAAFLPRTETNVVAEAELL